VLFKKNHLRNARLEAFICEVQSSMSPVTAVILDFGGVLYMPPDGHWLRRWQRVLGLKKDDALNEMFAAPEKSEYVRKVFTGEISEAQVWAGLARRWHVKPWMIGWIRKSGFSKKRFNRELANFVQALRPAYRTAILSNAGDQGRKYFCDAYHIDQLVDTVIISAEEGFAKPDERIFRRALERLGVQPEQAIFVDDLEENVLAASRLGINSIQFHHTQQVLLEIKALLDNHN
jgi:epoxide hydrolase-like predicted phosphatase